MFTEIQEGKALNPVVKYITQEKINLYAEASGDFNPIHIDESFAAKTPLGGTIAHGMLNLAYVSEMMTSAFGRAGFLVVSFEQSLKSRHVLEIL